ncbi:hypothetical protein C0993_002581 [Termitomyces sp. T159_Od127]|nr:hypothetical protein C0993_002581 [Termitomyces sp. T159_Od127]
MIEGGLGTATGSEGKSLGEKVFFANSGTEANEGALKVARKVGKERWAAAVPGRKWDSPDCTKTRIVCFEGSFHGRSMGALSVTANAKYQAPFAPLLPGVDVGRLNDHDGLKSLIGEDTCAVIVEPIQGEGGINAASVDWLRALRQRCDEVQAVLIYDEVQVGVFFLADGLMAYEVDIVWSVQDRNALGTLNFAGRLPSGYCNDG